MRVLFWYCDELRWEPSQQTLEDAAPATAGALVAGVAAFIHVEPADILVGSNAETKLVKNSKWLARKWETKAVLLHSFSHLAEEKAEPIAARDVIERALSRLTQAGYEAATTPYGHFNDLELKAPGHPLARIYKSW